MQFWNNINPKYNTFLISTAFAKVIKRSNVLLTSSPAIILEGLADTVDPVIDSVKSTLT